MKGFQLAVFVGALVSALYLCGVEANCPPPPPQPPQPSQPKPPPPPQMGNCYNNMMQKCQQIQSCWNSGEDPTQYYEELSQLLEEFYQLLLDETLLEYWILMDLEALMSACMASCPSTTCPPNVSGSMSKCASQISSMGMPCNSCASG